MTITPIAYFHSPLTSKFGIPRQSGLVEELPGHIVFTPPYRHEEAIRGLENFDYLWLIWEFSENSRQPESATPQHLTVRPPRLGGNERVGVFASRSPFRPNNLGLSCVRIRQIELTTDKGPVIHVLGADLMDGTPIYDVKPYLSFTDSHPKARNGFAEEHLDERLPVDFPPELLARIPEEKRPALLAALALDPRPGYLTGRGDPYGFPYAGKDVRFYVEDGTVKVFDVVEP